MKSYVNRLRDLRVDNDLKQSDVALVLETTQQHYSKYENGEYDMPIRAIIALADYYKVSADYILGRTPYKEGPEGLNRDVTESYKVGQLVADVCALNESGRKAVAEYVDLQKMKNTCTKKK